MEDQANQEQALLPLDAPRRVALKGKTQTYIWNLRRPADADWLRYFNSIVNQVLHVDGAREQVFDSETAICEFVDRLVTNVEGYGDLGKDWKASLPFGHRVAVGFVLRNVGPAAAEASCTPGAVEVALNASWTADGKTTFYQGLLHRFRHPSLADLRKFNYEAARVKVRGTAKDGETSYPSRQAIALQFYDDLIQSVDGYSVNGQPLTGVEAIRREMDGAHKAAAALQLFDGDEEVLVE